MGHSGGSGSGFACRAAFLNNDTVCAGTADQLTSTKQRRKKSKLKASEKDARKRAETRREAFVGKQKPSKNDKGSLGSPADDTQVTGPSSSNTSVQMQSSDQASAPTSPSQASGGIQETAPLRTEPASSTPAIDFTSDYRTVFAGVHEYELSENEAENSGSLEQNEEELKNASALKQETEPKPLRKNAEGSTVSATAASDTSRPVQKAEPGTHSKATNEKSKSPPSRVPAIVSETNSSQRLDGSHLHHGGVGGNGAVAPESLANIIEALNQTVKNGEHGNSRGRGSRASSDRVTSHPKVPVDEKQQAVLAQLVLDGVGGELLDCIKMPAGYHAMDSRIDGFCGRLRQPNAVYPNHPMQIACRKMCKHVVTQVRRVLSSCKAGVYGCLRRLWLSTVIPGVTTFTDILGIPEIGRVRSLAMLVLDATDKGNLDVQRYPELEANSCVFEHGIRQPLEKYDKNRDPQLSQKPPYSVKGRSDIIQSLKILLLLSQHYLVEPGMVAFLLSLLDMEGCKRRFKDNPKYQARSGLSVSSQGLFQALLADVVAEAFVIDVNLCTPEELGKTGTKASILCANLVHGHKLRTTLHPILIDIANNEWDKATARARVFAQNFMAAEINYKELQVAQASAKVYTTISVSLFFALSSWKGTGAKWFFQKKLLTSLLEKAFGEVVPSILDGYNEANNFAAAISQAAKDPTVVGDALLEHAEILMVPMTVSSLFYCQTGSNELGKILGGVVKTSVRKLAKMTKRDGKKFEKKLRSSSATQRSFLESTTPWNLVNRVSLYPKPSLHKITETKYYPRSFLLLPRNPGRNYSSNLIALIGSTTGIPRNSTVTSIHISRFKDTSFMKKGWWKILPAMLCRLREQGQDMQMLAMVVWIEFLSIGFTFSVEPNMAIEAIAAFSVLVAVLLLLDIIHPDAAKQTSMAIHNQ